jgi:hypothetical protein
LEEVAEALLKQYTLVVMGPGVRACEEIISISGEL